MNDLIFAAILLALTIPPSWATYAIEKFLENKTGSRVDLGPRLILGGLGLVVWLFLTTFTLHILIDIGFMQSACVTA